MNALNLGVPQRRERVFIVGFRPDLGIKEEDFSYPAPKDSSKKLHDILEKDRVYAKYYLSETCLAGYRRRENTTFQRKFLSSNDISGTLTANCDLSFVIDLRLKDFTPVIPIKGEINHEGIRRFTSRERAQLQGFPEEFRIEVADFIVMKQFGNAVAVTAVQATVEKIVEKICPHK